MVNGVGESAGGDGADQLSEDVDNTSAGGKSSPERHGDCDGGIEVATGDATDNVDADHKAEAPAGTLGHP